MLFYEVSSLTKENIDEMFNDIFLLIMIKNYQGYSAQQKQFQERKKNSKYTKKSKNKK